MFKYERNRLNYFGVLLLYCEITISQLVSHKSCSDIVNYVSFGEDYIGLLTISKLTFENTVVEVEFEQHEPIDLGNNGSLSLNQDLGTAQENLKTGKPISLRVNFPNSHFLPKITNIKVNHNTICHDQGLGEPSTTFRLQHVFSAVVLQSPLPLIPDNGQSIEKPVEGILAQRSPNLSLDTVCGREILTPFIAGGNELPRGKFPWLAAIYLRKYANLKFTCSGSLISSRAVITAAHCFPTSYISPDLISVYLGRHNLFISEEGSQQRDIKYLSIHPYYSDSLDLDGDIALLYMATAVEFSQYIRPICLWTQSANLSYIEGQSGFIAGWDSYNGDQSMTSVPKVFQARIVSKSECRRSSAECQALSSSPTLCVSNRDGTAPCIGCSGGVLMINIFGVWTLRGVHSGGVFKQGRCDLNQFSVYWDVAKYMTWINMDMVANFGGRIKISALIPVYLLFLSFLI